MCQASLPPPDGLASTHISGPRDLSPQLAATVAPGSAPQGAPDDVPLARGTAVGRYLIVEVLGQGGMGRVYSAYDPELERKVAIKLLRAASGGSNDTGGHVRLLREAQAMARLNHPNVVAVHDVGVFSGSVFVAMELVEGQTLADWLDAGKRSWREVVPIFVSAGRGLAAAHAAGLIHRDFKPANVLLGSDGRVRVTDFGLARAQSTEPLAALERPTGLSDRNNVSLTQSVTLAGSVMGTPGYMAPEQLVGEAATAETDQFNFAASLYEALFGKVPFPGTSLMEIVRAVGNGPPVPPEGTHVPAWLQKLVLRALSAVPGQRFPSLEVLLQELSLDREGQRRRWAVRGAVGAGLLLATAVALVRPGQPAPCAGAASRLETVWTPQLREKTKAAFLATGKPFAAVTYEQTAALLDGYRRAWIDQHTEACQATRVRNEQTEADLALRFDCLEHSRRDLDALGQLLSTADEGVMTNAVRAAGALRPLSRCADLEVLRQPVPPPASPAARDQLEQAQRTLAQARALMQAARAKDARPLVTPLLHLGDDPGFSPFHAEALLLNADLTRGEPAVGAYLDAIQMAERAHADSTRAAALIELARTVGYKFKRPAEADAFTAMALAAVERSGNDALLRARYEQAAADIEWSRGKYAEALSGYRQALELRQKVLGPSTEQVASSMYDVGWVLMELRDWVPAREMLTEAHRIRVELLGEEHPSTLGSLNSVAALATGTDDYATAIGIFERLLQVTEKQGAISDNVGAALTNLAITHRADGDPQHALEYAQRARKVYEQLYGPDSPNAATTLGIEAVALGDLGQVDAALPLANQVLALMRKSENPLQECQSLQHLSILHSRKGRFPLALSEAKEAVGKCDAAQGPESVPAAIARQQVAKVHLDAGDRAAALPLMEAVLPIFEKSGRPLELAEARFDLARALGNRGEAKTRATQLVRTARDVYAQKKRTRELGTVDAWLAANATP